MPLQLRRDGAICRKCLSVQTCNASVESAFVDAPMICQGVALLGALGDEGTAVRPLAQETIPKRSRKCSHAGDKPIFDSAKKASCCYQLELCGAGRAHRAANFRPLRHPGGCLSLVRGLLLPSLSLSLSLSLSQNLLASLFLSLGLSPSLRLDLLRHLPC